MNKLVIAIFLAITLVVCTQAALQDDGGYYVHGCYDKHRPVCDQYGYKYHGKCSFEELQKGEFSSWNLEMHVCGWSAKNCVCKRLVG